jgi:hypothetical protein
MKAITKKIREIKEIRIPADFYDAVEALNDADGYMERVVLYFDNNLCTVLEATGLANRNNRGSYSGGAKLKGLMDRRKDGYAAVMGVIKTFCKKRNIKVLVARVTTTYEEIE